MIKNDRPRQSPSISERQNQNSKEDLSFCVGHSLLTTQSVIWSLCFYGKGVLFFFSPEMSWISVGFGWVCKLVLHIIKRKKTSQRGKTKWMKIICWDSVSDTYCIKWYLTCLPYFPEWNFCCSPSLIPQGSTLLVTDKEFSKGAKRILTHGYPLEVWKSSRKQMFYTQKTPPNAHPPCLLWIVCFTFHQKVSLKPAYF